MRDARPVVPKARPMLAALGFSAADVARDPSAVVGVLVAALDAQDERIAALEEAVVRLSARVLLEEDIALPDVVEQHQDELDAIDRRLAQIERVASSGPVPSGAGSADQVAGAPVPEAMVAALLDEVIELPVEVSA